MVSSNIKKGSILCFGEVLWDALDSGLYPGGAPMNLAYHLAQMGWDSWPVSAVGDDFLGEELVSKLRSWGVNTDLICVHNDLPTGIVRVQLKFGIPSYDIVENVAWDKINIQQNALDSCTPVAALIFGSLAQRSHHNRESMNNLLDQFPNTLKVFDVNLRPPYIDRDNLFYLAKRADLIKVNDEELEELLGEPINENSFEENAKKLSVKTGCPMVCITAGSKGAGLLDHNQWFWGKANPIEVKDTIGAGDSFLSALVNGLLKRDKSQQEILETASKLAGFVASSAGATPCYPPELLA